VEPWTWSTRLVADTPPEVSFVAVVNLCTTGEGPSCAPQQNIDYKTEGSAGTENRDFANLSFAILLEEVLLVIGLRTACAVYEYRFDLFVPVSCPK
jgi:hypothetical protein